MYNIYEELNKITEYIEKHILEKITITELAHLVGLNGNTLKSIFSCLTGITINSCNTFCFKFIFAYFTYFYHIFTSLML